MRELSLRVNNVSICYRIRRQFSIKRNLLKNKKNLSEDYEAVKNVSFELRKGEVIGLVGHNGAGKSTLLRAIAGIYKADQGTIDLLGNTTALMALGVGFNPQLTGRDNVILSGMLMGMKKKEMEERFQEIHFFSELGDFIDMPVVTYSSGMYSKLAFSITACIDTNIMLVDEVLSVGDESFQKKSFSKMQELIENKNRSAIIVSHNSKAIQDFCERAIWIENGKIKEDGKTHYVLEHYREYENIISR